MKHKITLLFCVALVAGVVVAANHDYSNTKFQAHVAAVKSEVASVKAAAAKKLAAHRAAANQASKVNALEQRCQTYYKELPAVVRAKQPTPDCTL